MSRFSQRFIVLLLVYIQFTLLLIISLTPNNLDDPNTPDTASFKLVFMLPSLIVPFFSGCYYFKKFLNFIFIYHNCICILEFSSQLFECLDV